MKTFTRNNSLNDFSLKTLSSKLKAEIPQTTELCAFISMRKSNKGDYPMYAISIQTSIDNEKFYLYNLSSESFDEVISITKSEMFNIFDNFDKICKNHDRGKDIVIPLTKFLIDQYSFRKYHQFADYLFTLENEIDAIHNIAKQNIDPCEALEKIHDIKLP